MPQGQEHPARTRRSAAIHWTKLSCHSFRDNAVRLQLFALVYNLGNFMRTLALPTEVKHWSLTTLREKLIKIGAKVVRHGRYFTFQLAEVAVSRELFARILGLIERLRPYWRTQRDRRHVKQGEAILGEKYAREAQKN